MKVKVMNKMVVASLFAAMICVVTLVVHIPIAGGSGYINISDAFVITAGIFLGPLYGGIAAAIGSGLSDIIVGYSIYAPATIVIKAIVAILSYYMFNLLKKRKIISIIFASIIGEIPMAFLYLFYEYVILNLKEAAILDLSVNLIQSAISILVAIFLVITLNKTEIKNKYL